MLLGTTTSATALLGSLGNISANTYASIYAWIIVAVGIPLGFIVAVWLISLFKVEKEKREYMYGESKKTRAETHRLLKM